MHVKEAARMEHVILRKLKGNVKSYTSAKLLTYFILNYSEYNYSILFSPSVRSVRTKMELKMEVVRRGMECVAYVSTISYICDSKINLFDTYL